MNDTVSGRSLRDPRKRNRTEILQAKGGFPREWNTISELILRKSYQQQISTSGEQNERDDGAHDGFRKMATAELGDDRASRGN
ncbi:hypothetical protein GJ654_15540 [Rhodoblastus acidophilus]|uniref:Uncharacterized protein n=2 Tax=Rhodoblastus acidophilus TaxID=1074 RepID=A0A6N8DTA8_RHOAC|nr:hypothetical protein [Rhodoblastus acidophilus]MTV32401.1 hypothetical protein [Rhodoblastus acidophilus]